MRRGKKKPRRSSAAKGGPVLKKQRANDQSEEPTATSDSVRGFTLETLYRALPAPSLSPLPAPDGLRSGVAMYTYQKVSMTQMYKQEKGCGKKGGILCEEMGTGKTLICIGIILLTKGTQCTPIGHHKIHRAALPAKRTEAAAAASADVLPCEWSDEAVDNGSVLSLKALAGSLVKCATGAQLERMNLPVELREFIQALPSPYILYDHHRKRQDTKKPPRSSERRRASSSSEGDAQARGTSGDGTPRKGLPLAIQMYLSAATLIVVPATLIDQWIQEFHKYTLDNYLSILVIQSNQEFPPPEELSKYDVVLTSHTRISKERCTLNGYNSFSERCYCDFGVRSATCKSCQTYRPLSPLMQVYWLRLIIDEGHVMGNKQSNQANLAANLLCERKWACTGTPTPGLLMETELEHLFGLLMFLGHEPFCDRRVWADYIVRPIRKGVAAAEQRLLDILSQVMIKNKQEDIDKEIALPECHTSVVQLKLNDSERQKYNEIVSQIKTNLIASRGSGPDSFLHPANRKYAQRALTNLILYCFHFTPLDREQRELCLDVASEQLHDPKLRGELSEPEVADLQSVVEIMIAGDHTLEAHLLVSPRDASLDLHGDAAAPDPPSSSPPPGPPREEQPADLGRQGSAPAPPPTAGPSLEVLRQLRLQRFSPLDTPSTPVSPPNAIASAAAAALVCEEVMEDSLPAMETAPAPAPTDPPPTPSVDRDPSTVPVSSPPSFSFSDSFARPLPLLSPTTPTAPVQPTTSSAPACEEAAAPVHPGGVVAASPTAAASSSSAAASAGATSLLLKSALPEAAYIPLSEVNSTKLTYLLDRLQQLPEGSKAIIFSQFVHVLLILRQALRHVGLPFCEFFYGSHSSPAARASALTTFNTSDNVRVILMKTELAAFGINLTAASHVFFVDQVWDPSVERQAIKRAHRIGQTKEVFVEKLVMENTIEATILTFNQDKSLAPQTEATKGESELKAQRKVHSLLRSLEFIHRLGGDGAEAEDEDGDPGVILGKRARQLFGRAGDARDDPRSKGKEKSDDVEDEGEQAIASIDLRREKKRKKTVKRVRFMEPDESETVTEEGAASSTSTTSSSSSAREPSTDDVVRKRSRDGAEEGRALLLQGSVGPDDDVSDSIQAAAHGTPPKRVRFLDDDSSSSAEQGE